MAPIAPRALIACVVSVGVGMVVTSQATLLAGMTRIIGNPFGTTFLSFNVGLSALSSIVFGQYMYARHKGTLEPIVWDGITWWEVMGGPLGAFELTARAFIAEKIGLTPQAVSNITGQILLSLFLDHLGWLGLPHKPIGVNRVAGAVAVLTGCILSAYEKMSQANARSDIGEIERLALMALAFVGGSLLPVQAGLNRKLGERLPPCYSLRLPATLVSFFTGYVFLVFVLLGTQYGLGRDILGPIPASMKVIPLYMYLGGLLGILYVGGGVILSSEIGVGGFLVSGVLGQLSLGLVFDSIGIVREPVPVSVAAVIGALMVFAGALVITLASPSTSARGGRSGGWPGKAGAGFNGEGSQYAEFDQEKTEVREIKEGEDEAEGNHVGGLCGEKQKIVAVVS